MLVGKLSWILSDQTIKHSFFVLKLRCCLVANWLRSAWGHVQKLESRAVEKQRKPRPCNISNQLSGVFVLALLISSVYQTIGPWGRVMLAGTDWEAVAACNVTKAQAVGTGSLSFNRPQADGHWKLVLQPGPGRLPDFQCRAISQRKQMIFTLLPFC